MKSHSRGLGGCASVASVDRRQPPSRNAPRPHPRQQNLPELKVAGRNACRALYDKRPQDIRRVYLVEENIPFFADALKFCARERIAYHVKTSADLDVVAETVHHDGVLFLAREKLQPSFEEVLLLADKQGPLSLVLLENVKNPHNLGAILRVCAHFGVPAVLAAGQTPSLSPAVMRTAEGGAEHVALVAVGDGRKALAELQRRGVSVIATSSHTDGVLGRMPLPSRSVVLFGSEGEGLSRGLLEEADVKLAIPGSGALESLNVACASSVILWELWRDLALPMTTTAGAGTRSAERPPPKKERLASTSPARHRETPAGADQRRKHPRRRS